MEIFGSVVAILDEVRLVVRLDKFISSGTELTVFAAIEKPELKQIGLDELLIPKGQIRITVRQNAELYLASRYQETSEGARSFGLSPLEFALSGKISWSATFDKSQSLGIEYAKEIRVGDPVGDK